MKRIIISLLLFFSLCSCSLDLFPESSVSSDSYWKTEEDAKAAVNGLYTKMRSSISAYYWVYWFDGRSGIVGPGSTPGDITKYNANDLSSSMSNVTWTPLYQVISQANAVICNIDKVQYSTKETRNELLAQSLFFRAWCYYNLVRLWGDVPVVTDFISSLDNPQLYPERSPEDKVWSLIESDINEADRLYASREITSRNRVSRAAILMLKTDIYLWKYKVEKGESADLDVAEKAISEVVSSFGNRYSILPKYDTVFDKEDNNEIIFSLYFDVKENSSQYGTLFAQVSTVPSAIKNNPVPCGNTTSQPMMFSQSFVDEYLKKVQGDARVPYIYNETPSGTAVYKWTKKYMGEIIGGKREFNTDIRMYRYAEALMFYAEVLVEKNDVSGAVEQLNKVVKRAYGKADYYNAADYTKETFLDILLDERVIEFAGECKSWFDMIRFGKVFDRVASLKGRENDKNGNILLMPVYYDTISRNSKIIQTSGYED